MATLADFIFFDGSSTGTTSNAFAVPYGASELTLQVEDLTGGGVDLTLEGTTEIGASGPWATVGVIGIGDFSTAESIAAEGIYNASADGIRRFRMVNGGTPGSVRVHAVAVG